MDDNTTGTSAMDTLTWDDWDLTPAQICSLENGADCGACEG